MSDVIDLGERRTRDEYQSCECGCTMFRLAPARMPDGTFVRGAAFVTSDFMLGGYSGVLVCDDCYRELDTGLRAVTS